MSEHFSLQWDDFHKNMSSGMQSLLESEDLADVTLAVEGRQLKAHKMVLSLCSPYFRQLFQSSPCKHPIVFMRDVSYTSLIDLLQFMYQGEVQVAQENFPTFIKTAAALQIKGLAEDSTNQSGEITEATKRHPAEVLPPLPMQCETKAKRCRRLGSKRVRVSSPSPSSSPAAAVEPAENVIFLKTEPSDSVEASTDGEVADETRDSYVDETLLEEDNTLMETNEDSKPGTSSDGIGDSQLTLRMEKETPENILEQADKANENLLPKKSRLQYDKEYHNFDRWMQKNDLQITQVSETVLMGYFQELSESFSPNSLWSKYSMLRSTLLVYKKIDIKNYGRLETFLKQHSKGYIPTKSKILTREDVLKFMKEAPDDTFLLEKVVLVMGIFGGLRRDELVKLNVDDVDDRGAVVVVKIQDSKTGGLKNFLIIEEEEMNALSFLRKYTSLRPKGIKERRYFLGYRNGRCISQVVGKNTFGSVPSKIAKYLGYVDAKQFTGHCLRRTSATMQVGIY